jgi:hypothetical protein
MNYPILPIFNGLLDLRNKAKETLIWNDGPLQLSSQSGLKGQHCDSKRAGLYVEPVGDAERRFPKQCLAVFENALLRPLETFGGNAT